MKLHLDRFAFQFVVDDISKKCSVRPDVLEKDYYVTLLLRELSKKEHQTFAYFKGGTALYKALKSIRRFSEDIDLTVYIEDCPTASQAKKRLENAALKFTCLEKGETLENHRGSITCEYLYESMYALDKEDALQRFGKVKIEATSFTVSEPNEKILIAPHLYELATSEQQKIMYEVYDVEPFEIETISLERIFIDKLFAAQFYFERKKYSDVAKHVYDLTVLLENGQIKAFLTDSKRVLSMIGYKRKEELNRKGGVAADMQISNFDYFRELDGNMEFETAFDDMQRIYVFNERDKLSLETVFSALSRLREIMDIESVTGVDKYPNLSVSSI